MGSAVHGQSGLGKQTGLCAVFNASSHSSLRGLRERALAHIDHTAIRVLPCKIPDNLTSNQ